uniref:Uncharacterized protein n=1 Tax=Anguilla anguilla TaxID=7936 RepID=A0A0E9PQB5_ANGAN
MPLAARFLSFRARLCLRI